MDPEEIMTGLGNEIGAALAAMREAKSLEEKRTCSETLRNLCESLGVFLRLATEVGEFEDEGGPIPF